MTETVEAELEKRMVKARLKRVCYFDMKKEMTKEEYETFKEHHDGLDISGADALDEMGDDASREPDDWEDEMDEIESDWDD